MTLNGFRGTSRPRSLELQCLDLVSEKNAQRDFGLVFRRRLHSASSHQLSVQRHRLSTCTGCSKKRIPNFIFGITLVIQHRL